MPFVQVSTICQDSKGYLWTGGYGGLSKFDGTSFTNFNKEDGLSSTLVNSVKLDYLNRLWVGTAKGLNYIKNDTLFQFTDLNDHVINEVNTDASHIIAVSDHSIFLINEDSIIDTISLDKETNITATLIRKDTVWIGTKNGLFYSDLLNNKLDSIGKFSGIQVYCFYDDSSSIYIGHTRGFCKLSANDTSTFNYKNGLIGSGVTAIHRVDKNSIWLATEFGINEFNDNKFKLINVGAHNGSNKVISFYKDREDNTWLGTMYGLFKTSGNAFKNYSFSDGLMSSFIFQIQRDHKNQLWIGTRDDGIYRYANGSFYHYTQNHGLLSNFAKSVMPIGDSIFIGTYKGLSILYKNKFTNYKSLNNTNLDAVNVIYHDPNGNIWLGGDNKLIKLGRNNIQNIQKFDLDGNVWALHTDSMNRLWIGTYQGGLFRLSKDSIENMNEKWSLDNDNFLGITQDNKGNLWFATFEGILKWNSKTDSISHYTSKNGLNSSLVYTIVYDSVYQKIWAGTNQGITQIDLSKNTEYPSIINLGVNDGFTGVECNTHGTYLDSNGIIWFGTVNGLISFDQEAYKQNNKPNLLHITKTSLFYKDTLLNNNSTLEYYQNNLGFEYKGICLSNTDKVFYQYRLVGFNNQWSPPVKETKTNYSNLNPGDYVFEVKSMNNSGVWNSTPTRFHFTIASPYWKTWWFKIILGIAFIGTVSLIFFLRVQQLNNKNMLARRFDQMKLQALRAQMNPHFIFNSLNSIQHFINSNEKREANRYLSKFAKLMRLTLDNSKKQGVSLTAELNALTLYLELEKLRFEDKFIFEIEVENDVEQDSTIIPSMLIQPYIENAILHGFNKLNRLGEIQIHIKKEQNHIVCSITDNGIGRDASRALQLKSQIKRNHQSAGLTLTSERLSTFNEYYKEQLKVDISDLKNELNEPTGTLVVLSIPIINLLRLN